MKHAKHIFILYEVYRSPPLQVHTGTKDNFAWDYFPDFIFVLVSFSCETWGRRFPVLILLCRTWGKKTCNTHNILQSVQFSLDTPHILEEGQKHGGGGMLFTLNNQQFAVFNSKYFLCTNQITNFTWKVPTYFHNRKK